MHSHTAKGRCDIMLGDLCMDDTDLDDTHFRMLSPRITVMVRYIDA